MDRKIEETVKNDIIRSWYEEQTIGKSAKKYPLQSLICANSLVYDEFRNNHINELLMKDLDIDNNREPSLCLRSTPSRWSLSKPEISSESSPSLFSHIQRKLKSNLDMKRTPRTHSVAQSFRNGISIANDMHLFGMQHKLKMKELEKQLMSKFNSNAAANGIINSNNRNGNSMNNSNAIPTLQKHINNSSTYPQNGGNIRQHNVASNNSNKVHTDSTGISSSKGNGISRPDDGQEESNLSKRFKSARQEYVKEGGNINSIAKKPFSVPNAVSNASKGNNSSCSNKSDKDKDDSENLPPELQQFEKALVERIEADIVSKATHTLTSFEDISGLQFAKKCVQEVVCWPMLRPDLFIGLRALPKGVLLFGPPGTGKTLIGKAIAHQVGATFFSISASSLTSKWTGEGERLVRTLFGVAVYRQPAIIFIDEVDSLLSNRSSEENEASRRMKTEFLVQLDGANTDDTAQVVIIGATNRPDELDDAARRRFVKRIYIPLPDREAREQMLLKLLGTHVGEKCEYSGQGRGGRVKAVIYHTLSDKQIKKLVRLTAGYSGADIRSLCAEAAMGPVREVSMRHMDLTSIDVNEFPPISWEPHIMNAIDSVSATVSIDDLVKYKEWNSTFGTYRKLQIIVDEYENEDDEISADT